MTMWDGSFDQTEAIYTEEKAKAAVVAKLHGLGDGVLAFLILIPFIILVWMGWYTTSLIPMGLLTLFGIWCIYKRLDFSEDEPEVDPGLTKRELVDELARRVQIMIDNKSLPNEQRQLFLTYQEEKLPRLESFLESDDDMTNKMFLDIYQGDIERLKGYANAKLPAR